MKIDTWDEGRYSQSVRVYGFLLDRLPTLYCKRLNAQESCTIDGTYRARAGAPAPLTEIAVAMDLSEQDMAMLVSFDGATKYDYQWVARYTTIMPVHVLLPIK